MTKSFDEFFDEQMKDPAVKAAYDELTPSAGWNMQMPIRH